MSARRMNVALDLMDPALFENGQLIQGETVTVLDQLKTCVKEAKSLVHQTQSKVEELAKSIDETKGPVKDARKK